jgi:hypothetical protein
MGLILKDYGRKFHLKFVDGTEKTYDASELEFIKDEDEFAKGGKTDDVIWHKYENNIYEADLGNFMIRISPETQKGYWGVEVLEGKKNIGKANDIYGIDNAKEKAYSIIKRQYMAKGGKVTFKEKVSAIKKSLLKTKKVAPKVQKDYGKTYSKNEALLAAQRIAGSIKSKLEAKKNK